MEAVGFVRLFVEVFQELGLSDAIIVIQFVIIVALAREVAKAQKRLDDLIDRMFAMAKETTIMMERITGK